MKVSEPESGQERERAQRRVAPDTNRNNDVYAWLLSQANRLRESRPEAVDWLGLAEELEDIVALQRAKVISLLSIVQAHLLKWHYSRIRRAEHSWRKSIVNARTELNLILDESRILRNELPGCIAKAYVLARRLAGTDMRLARRDWEQLFPDSCPWTAEEILDQDFFPALAPTANGRI
jgi:hypothetical protein